MITVTLDPQTETDVQLIAEFLGKTVSEVVTDGINAAFFDINRQKIRIETEAYQKIHASLLPHHLGNYVAIHNGEVVDHDSNKSALTARIRERFGRLAVLIRQVEASPELIISIRSPRRG